MPSYVVANHCVNAAITLYFYERALTIGQEIDLIWRRGSRNLFMFALYNGMHVCTIVYLLLEIARWVLRSGYIASLAQTAILCALYLIWGAISALRVYAINGRKKWTPLATMAFSLVPIATNVFSLVDATQMNPQYVCCCGQAALSVEAATRVGVMAADSLVLLETWRNTYSLNRLVRGLTTTPSITSLLLRDGTTYFCVLLAVNIIATVLCVKNVSTSPL
ncbi:uncharacterized protein B0H18DRAFT_63190 [Fomitopsis serialis]|uniref:uncharacterized protein n=1 Tax=Fomitopsis serialis TaxID=139415 RepID=UPI0020086EE6|nr:uncharacterized protein B0H18DRAFT_63190 [Neoantrodia serialis]KAH9916642.1 hypothetical protein B0H18DRAFT_63190 [Neoantrodia serialis]